MLITISPQRTRLDSSFDINGLNEETMTDIIYAKTGLRSYEQCKDEAYSGTNELDSYYCLDEEEDNYEDEEDEEEE